MEEREPFDAALAQLDGQLAELEARQLEVRASLTNAEAEARCRHRGVVSPTAPDR